MADVKCENPEQSWQQTKSKLQQKWGINISSSQRDLDWSGLASDTRERLTRVGGHLLDTLREVAREAGLTVADTTALLQGEGEDVGRRAKDLGVAARKSLNAAKVSVDQLAAMVKEGLAEGVEKSQSRESVPKSVAEGMGIAAGAVLNAIVGKTSK